MPSERLNGRGKKLPACGFSSLPCLSPTDCPNEWESYLPIRPGAVCISCVGSSLRDRWCHIWRCTHGKANADQGAACMSRIDDGSGGEGNWPHSSDAKQVQLEGPEQKEAGYADHGCREISDANSSNAQGIFDWGVGEEYRQESHERSTGLSDRGIWPHWPPEPDVGRVAHGVAYRVDRITTLGNGQVPRVAKTAWRLLLERVSPGSFRL